MFTALNLLYNHSHVPLEGFRCMHLQYLEQCNYEIG